MENGDDPKNNIQVSISIRPLPSPHSPPPPPPFYFNISLFLPYFSYLSNTSSNIYRGVVRGGGLWGLSPPPGTVKSMDFKRFQTSLERKKFNLSLEKLLTAPLNIPLPFSYFSYHSFTSSNFSLLLSYFSYFSYTSFNISLPL